MEDCYDVLNSSSSKIHPHGRKLKCSLSCWGLPTPPPHTMLEDVLGAVARNSRRTTRGSAVVTEHINIVLGGGGKKTVFRKTALKFVAGLAAGNVLCRSTTCPMRDHTNIISKHYATPYLTCDLDMTAHCSHLTSSLHLVCT